MKRFVKKILNRTSFTVLLTALLFSCASSSLLTDSLGVLGGVAELTGHGATAKELQAASDISKAAEDITPENEYYIGRSVAASLLTHYKVYNGSFLLESYVNKICAVLVENSEYPELFNGYHVKLINSDEVNAFSTSGGHIFITLGLLKCAQNEDALAAVVAHEIAHIQLHHSLNSIKKSRRTAALISTADATATVVGKQAGVKNMSEIASAMAEVVGGAVDELINKGFSKEQEFEADKLALTLMSDAGYDSSAMLEMLSVMKKNQNGSSSGAYKTHPSPDARIKKVESALSGNKRSGFNREKRKSRFTAAAGNL